MAEDLRHLHERDFVQWAQGQARALREQRFDDVDREILANELERLVARERSELTSRLETLTAQLLMWAVQPAMRTAPFQAVILEQRTFVDSLLKSNPSLRGGVEAALPRTYAAALDSAEQAGIARSAFPAEAVFTLDQLVDRGFWPASLYGGKAFSF